MNTADLFNYATIAMLVPWGMMVFLPRGKYTEQVAFLAVFLFIAAAIWVIGANIAEGRNEGNLFSLDGLSHFFQNRDMMLAGWLNYLAFSLCAGHLANSRFQRDQVGAFAGDSGAVDHLFRGARWIIGLPDCQKDKDRGMANALMVST